MSISQSTRRAHVDTDVAFEDNRSSLPITLEKRVVRMLEEAVKSGECSEAFSDAVSCLIHENLMQSSDQDLRIAHIVHRVMRAEANTDGADLSKAVRSPDLKVIREGETRIALPDQVPECACELDELIHRRRSTPVFNFQPLSLVELAAFLRMSCGSKGVARAYQRRDIPRRVFASAGGLQSVDIQVIVQNVEGIEPGRYHYDPLEHSLVLAEIGDFRLPIVATTLGTDWLMHAQAVIAIIGNFNRVSWKYGSRGYRYMGLDAGNVCGQMYLAGASMNLAINAVAAFRDDALNSLLRVDGRDHFAQLLVSVGNKPGIRA